ncbi:MAG TPA: hypothetical protein VJR02_23555 [Pyrinomonadaceae bacterium]|nr:hypothetical protein [Pyrinomonadaceae bacterium]
MDNINLDPIIRVAGDSSGVVVGEQKLVTIDLNTGRAIEKGFFVRLAGNYQDYIVTNDRNPLHTVNAKVPSYYVRDSQNNRTLSIDIAITAVKCPPGSESKVAESLHGQQTPGQIFEGLLIRWLGEFIVPGDEWRFIESFNVARQRLETHIENRAATQTGLELTVKITFSGEATVPDEIVVGPIEIGVRLHGYTEEQKLTVEAGLGLDPDDKVRAFVFDERLDSAEELFKRTLKEYFFQNVTFSQFTYELHYPSFKQQLLQALSPALRKIGRTVRFINFSTRPDGIDEHPREFVPVKYEHKFFIPGRPQPVIIQNTVQLYCADSVAFKASKITDLEGWVKETLNVSLSRHLIGKKYVDLLLRFAEVEQYVKADVTTATAGIGYRVDHLVSAPNLEKEKDGLTNPFPLETGGSFETSIEKFKVELKFSIRLCIPELDSIEKYLNPGTDVKEAIKQNVLGETAFWLRKIHPERFYLYFQGPNEAASDTAGEDELLPVKELVRKKIQESLKKEFNARILDLSVWLGRSDLTDRYHDLCFVIRDFRIEIKSPDPQATEDLTLTGNFELLGVHPDVNSWRRFSVLQLDLDGLSRQLETHLKAELKNYYQSRLMYQNHLAREQVFKVVKRYAETYMHEEFGLKIHLTNLDRNTTKVEEDHRKFLVGLEEKKLRAEADQCQLLVNRINELKKRRVQELSVYPVDQATLKEVNENIKLLEKELEDLRAPRFRNHLLATSLADQLPDDLPTEDSQTSRQAELQPGAKAQLVG